MIAEVEASGVRPGKIVTEISPTGHSGKLSMSIQDYLVVLENMKR
jgi:hypothetical protein